MVEGDVLNLTQCMRGDVRRQWSADTITDTGRQTESDRQTDGQRNRHTGHCDCLTY